MGVYSTRLSGPFAEFCGVVPGQRALDVGCGPGALTGELVRLLGAASVVAVDPSPSFVEAASTRHPDVDVRRASSDELPFADGEFDLVAAQLVVHFMGDPVAGIREMGRVARSGGVVAACVWDHQGGGGPLEAFWAVARGFDDDVADESERAGTREGHLVELFAMAGLTDVEGTALTVTVTHRGFDDWWEPFTLGVGPAGVYVSGLTERAREELRARCRAALPDGPFDVVATAWAARGRAGRG